MEDKIKDALFLLLFGLIFMLPLAQGQLHIVDVHGLDGAYTLAPKPDFSLDKWLDGSYQQEKSNYVNDYVGFRPYMARVSNQLDYTLFRKLHANGIMMGKDNYLYQAYYTDDYCAKQKLDTTQAKESLQRLKALQDTLERLGKTVVVLHAPSKASLYPEYIPADLACVPGISNHDLYKHIADSLGIHQLDIYNWFISIKGATKEMLMSRQGVHWTVYGSVLAADTLIKYIEHDRNIKMPSLKWNKVEHTTKPRLTDDDIAKALNLIFPICKEVFCYPEVYYVTDSTKIKPKTIYIGDSFVWTLISNGMMKNTNTDWQFWDAFHEVKNQHIMDRNTPGIPISDYNWIKELESTDCLVFVYTSHNLPKLGDGFIDKAYNHFYPEN